MKPSKIAATAIIASALSTAALATTYDRVKIQGHVYCGVSQGIPGFASQNPSGNWVGFDVDICRAVAAAVLGDAAKVKYIPLSVKERFTALQSGEIDVLARTTTWTLARDVYKEANLAGVTFLDGSGLMVRKNLGVKSAMELNRVKICVAAESAAERDTEHYFHANKLEYTKLLYESPKDATAGYEAGICDVYAAARLNLAAFRSELKDPDAHIVLTETTSLYPAGILVKHGDDQWQDMVRWTINCLIGAEEGELLTAENKGDPKYKPSARPSISRMRGIVGGNGDVKDDLELCVYVAQQVGDYGQIYDKWLGPQTKLNLERGLNRLWNDGGLLYAPPIY